MVKHSNTTVYSWTHARAHRALMSCRLPFVLLVSFKRYKQRHDTLHALLIWVLCTSSKYVYCLLLIVFRIVRGVSVQRFVLEAHQQLYFGFLQIGNC